nr:hypothetical protein [Pedobacter sp.]
TKSKFFHHNLLVFSLSNVVVGEFTGNANYSYLSIHIFTHNFYGQAHIAQNFIPFSIFLQF